MLGWHARDAEIREKDERIAELRETVERQYGDIKNHEFTISESIKYIASLERKLGNASVVHDGKCAHCQEDCIYADGQDAFCEHCINWYAAQGIIEELRQHSAKLKKVAEAAKVVVTSIGMPNFFEATLNLAMAVDEVKAQ